MAAEDDEIAALVEELSLTMRGTVYGRGASGQYTTAVKTNLKCSLTPVNRQPAATSAQRSELAAAGDLEYERTYTMPANAQIAVDAYGAVRWNVRTGTVWPEFGPGGGVINYRADVVKAT